MNLEDKTLDEIFLKYDTAFQSGEFSKVDTSLQNLDVSSLTEVLLIGHLAAAFPGKDKLPYWKAFREAVEVELLKRYPAEQVIPLLKGLS